MYELLCVGLYGHLPCPSISLINSKPLELSSDDDTDEETGASAKISASVDELTVSLAAITIDSDSVASFSCEIAALDRLPPYAFL